MAVKSKTKAKPASKKKTSTASKKTKGAEKKTKPVKKPVAAKKASTKAPARAAGKKKTAAKSQPVEKQAAAAPKAVATPIKKPSSSVKASSSRAASPAAKRTTHPVTERRRSVSSSLRASQFSFMKAPSPEHAFEVGDNVEVFCDHEKSRERVRGWIKGIVVQVDNKMVAVQFRSNVFLTDGWMVPDRILWYPLASEHIRPVGSKKTTSKKDFIPDY